jgi:NAD(P)H-dependent FMN reductase
MSNLNTLIVSSSLQANSQTLKIANYLKTQIEQDQNHKVTLLDLQSNPLPFWNTTTLVTDKQTLKPLLEGINSLILLTPEYCGACSPSLKNFILFLDRFQNHLPTLLVSVSSGRSGSYPISELRAFGFKNPKLNFIPEHLVVRNCTKILNPDQTVEMVEPEYKKEHLFMVSRIDYTLNILGSYAQAYEAYLKYLPYNVEFANGM